MFRVAALEVVVEGAAGTAPPHDQAGVAGEKWRGGKGEEAQEEGGGISFPLWLSSLCLLLFSCCPCLSSSCDTVVKILSKERNLNHAGE